MKLLIYEHVSAGAFREKAISPSVLCEGFGMLRTAVEDAKSAGHTITTILDEQIAVLNPPLLAGSIIAARSLVQAENVLFEAAENCDAEYIIAPETKDRLHQLVQKIEQTHAQSLNSTSSAIAQASNKSLLKQHASKLGLATPKTFTFTIENHPDSIVQTISEKIGFPAVLKPAQNVGCEALSIVKSEEQAKAAITKLLNHAGSPFIAQPLIQGIAASVTLISNGTEAQPIALNKQHITLKPPNQLSNYKGGTTPFDDKSKTEAFTSAKQLVESIKGLQGYIGVDLVLTENEPVMIEVNPRLTTSYVGIRKTLKFNLMQATINAILTRELPKTKETTCYAHFEKIKTTNPTNPALQQTFTMPEIISPPFPLTHSGFTYALLCTQGATPQQAKRTFGKAKKRLQTKLQNGGKRTR